ncbi:MerR family transcriptional regulator [Marinobacterium aestuarii]|uniref:MerR family transcriptional regulator n=1 Tax=Marinobacterium aestuarii TaxID=1821621 RepID=A0A1A9EWF9_9GAMM|nr:MerR family DNA-binding transcriptional regulator [Marinobacterium aestuarii]ANG62246.1 MerR family transcriptional regulator [Marinobacterium aestuarii]
MNTQTRYSISDLAREFDITTRSIRFYEDQGLLSPERRGQTRIYSRQDRVRLKLILRGKRLGFSLTECGELFELWDHSNSGSELQLRLMLTRIAEKRQALEQQLRDIAMMQQELDGAEVRCNEALNALAPAGTAATPAQE